MSIETRRKLGTWLDRWVPRITLAVSAGVIVIMAWVALTVTTSNTTTNKLSSSADLLSCRALVSAKVTQARSAVEDTARRYELVYGEAVEHATRDDNPARLAELLAELPELRATMLDQSAATLTAADANTAAVVQSYNDPRAFLAACKRGEGPFDR